MDPPHPAIVNAQTYAFLASHLPAHLMEHFVVPDSLDADGVSEQNLLGKWVPSIPLPLTLRRGRVQCRCGEQFRGVQRYREHYAYAHVAAYRPPG